MQLEPARTAVESHRYPEQHQREARPDAPVDELPMPQHLEKAFHVPQDGGGVVPLGLGRFGLERCPVYYIQRSSAFS